MSDVIALKRELIESKRLLKTAEEELEKKGDVLNYDRIAYDNNHVWPLKKKMNKIEDEIEAIEHPKTKTEEVK